MKKLQIIVAACSLLVPMSSQAVILDTLVSADVRTYTSGVTVQRDTVTDSLYAYAHADFGTTDSASIDSLFWVDNVTSSTLDMIFDGNLYGGSTGGSGMDTPDYPPQNFSMVHYHADADSTMTYDWTVNYPGLYGGTDVLHFYLYETDGSLPTHLEGASYATPGWRQLGYGGAALQSSTTYSGQGTVDLLAGKNYAFAIWHNLNIAGGMAGTSFHKGMDGTVAIDFGVAAVPIPPTIWLFGSGLLGLAGMARRRKTT